MMQWRRTYSAAKILMTGFFLYLLFSSFSIPSFDFKFVKLSGCKPSKAPEESQSNEDYRCSFKLDTLYESQYSFRLKLKNITGDTIAFADLGNSGGHFITLGVSPYKIAPKQNFETLYAFNTIGRENSFVNKSKPVIFGSPKGIRRIWFEFSGFVKAPPVQAPAPLKTRDH